MANDSNRSTQPALPLPTSSTEQAQRRNWKPRVSAATTKIIAEIGLRYRPAATVDLPDHHSRLAMLAQDLADIPPDLLERAARDHARQSNFMPKAAELIELAQGYVNGAASNSMGLQEQCDVLNAMRWVRARNVRYEIRTHPSGTKIIEPIPHHWPDEGHSGRSTTPPLTSTQIEKLAHGGPMSQALFSLGKKLGYIKFNDGRWVDSEFA